MEVVAPIKKKKVAYPHQIQTEIFLLSNKLAYNLSACGSGKTFGAALGIRELYRFGVETRIIVIAPLSVLRATWVEHFEEDCPGMTLVCLDNSATRRKLAANLPKDNCIVLINPDGLQSVFHELKDWSPGLIVIDELAGYYRNSRTQRWKALGALKEITKPAIWAFTGTPITKSLMDAYAQILLITPHNLPKDRKGRPISFPAFRDMLMIQVAPNIWRPKVGATERVMAMMQPAIRFSREDVMKDIKEPIRIRKDIALTAEQTELLRQLQQEGIAQFGKGVIKGKDAMTAKTKLCQIVMGDVYASGGSSVAVPSGPRIQALLDLFTEVEESPIIVAVPFINVLLNLQSTLRNKGLRVEVIYGDTMPKERERIIKAFQAGELDFLLCHPKTLAHGVTLTRSSTVCWYGPIYDLELYAQLCDRIFRFGQTGQPLIVEFCSTMAERGMYSSLHQKEEFAFSYLDLF